MTSKLKALGDCDWLLKSPLAGAGEYFVDPTTGRTVCYYHCC